MAVCLARKTPCGMPLLVVADGIIPIVAHYVKAFAHIPQGHCVILIYGQEEA